MDEYSLYIHFPFCIKRCSYCDFYSTTSATAANFDKYTKKVLEHLDYFKTNFSSQLSTIYYGGGTPSILTIEYHKIIIEKIISNFTLSKNYEWTIEINPETVTEELLLFIKKSPINRISVGIQSTNERLLAILGRNCSLKQVYNAMNLIKKIGFDNLSVDFISAIPTMTLSDLKKNIKFAKKYRAKHISLYDLTLLEDSEIYKEFGTEYNKKLDNISEELLSKNGYHQYEISNYSKKDYESKHNLSYWKMKNFFGIGPSASGTYLKNGEYFRQTTVDDFSQFLEKNVEEVYTIEKLSKDTFTFEKIMMGLRLNEGIDIDYKNRLVQPLLKHSEYFQETKTKIFLTKEGRKYLNMILLEIL